LDEEVHAEDLLVAIIAVLIVAVLIFIVVKP